MTTCARPTSIPEDAARLRVAGPFDQDSLPAGLRRDHSLKAGSWGRLLLIEGEIEFHWDDSAGGSVKLQAPAEIVVPPTVVHHLAGEGPFLLLIVFYRET